MLAALPLRGSVEDALKTVNAIGREGQGNEAASVAWQEIVRAGPAVLPQVLAAVGTGTPVADNWLRLAGDTVVSNALRAKQPLPLSEVRAFLEQTSHPAPGRQLAFDLLQRADPAQADALVPAFIHDPVQELRRGAVQRVIDSAKMAKGSDAAKPLWLQALEAVRDEDQTRLVAGELNALGAPVDLAKQFGFVMKWDVVGPFENKERTGFEKVFPPEKEIRLDATYEGAGKPVKWRPFTSTDDYGKIDLNKPLGMLKEVTGYAVTTFDSPTEREAEIRLGCKDAWKIWVNGEFLFGRDEYHRGQQMDQYKLKCHLRKGANTILVKCCQNEQKEEWTVEWEFQLRVCDSAGTAILSGK
ncbi:MAG TPA: hypothetical protein VGO11_26905 [Chthoniobacteraceae bacterium]|jgi:hypothetical protein|nr:hypothetical protein [Chthoniobacteraceae bacterium]